MAMILETLLGGLGGGLMRLAPELLKFFDRANERNHELAMANIEVQIAEKKIEFGMREVDAKVDIQTLEAIKSAMANQTEMVKLGGKFVAFMSALVRPAVTYFLFGMYAAVKAASMSLAHDQGASWREVLVAHWGPDDMAMLFAVLSFWFVSRTLERKAK
jgi:hypothetical protein